MTPFARAEAATFWITRRAIKRDAQGRTMVRVGFVRGVAIGGGFVVTTAHGVSHDPDASTLHDVAIIGRVHVHVLREPALHGGQPRLTIGRDQPPDRPTSPPDPQRLQREGVDALREPGERPIEPIFADPYADLAMLLGNVRETPVPVRLAPIITEEAVHIYAGDRGWIRAVAKYKPAALVEISDYDPSALGPGDCGAPLLDERGELVGIVSLGEKAGYVAQLCMALPSWVVSALAVERPEIVRTLTTPDRIAADSRS